MPTQIQDTAFGASGSIGFGSAAKQRQGDATPILPSGWWLAPFLLSGTMFWLWFIPVLTKTII